MTFAATIVYIYSYPLIQCFMCGLAILTMIFYMVSVRPYKMEN